MYSVHNKVFMDKQAGAPNIADNNSYYSSVMSPINPRDPDRSMDFRSKCRAGWSKSLVALNGERLQEWLAALYFNVNKNQSFACIKFELYPKRNDMFDLLRSVQNLKIHLFTLRWNNIVCCSFDPEVFIFYLKPSSSE